MPERPRLAVAPAKLAAAALAVVMVGGLALGARCTSAARARCSAQSLFGTAPRLDVPYAVTRPGLVAAMLDLGAVGVGTRVLDLGSGDGRILRAAAARGATGLGVDIDPVLVAEATAEAADDGVGERVRFVAQDLFATPLGGYDVVTMYLLPSVNLRLRPRLLAELAPGARVVSHAFRMGDWRPDAVARVGGATAYLWIVPARVAGRWRLADGRVLEVRQTYQDVAATLDGAAVGGVTLRGDRIAFMAGGQRYAGKVGGDAIVGAGWSARRLPAAANRANPTPGDSDPR